MAPDHVTPAAARDDFVYSRQRQLEETMTMTSPPPTSSTIDMLAAARDLGPTIREYAAETERTRQCPPTLVEILHKHRMFDMITPAKYGGLEDTIPNMVRVLEELATHDASTGWVVGIGNGTAIISAFLPEEDARAMFVPGAVSGGAQAPNGRATPVDGGYRVSGRWPFGSGSTHCSVIVGGTFVMDGNAPRMNGGMPDFRTAVFPVKDVEIIDTWHVAGLRGTGSHDIEVKDVFVPEGRMLRMYGGAAVVDGPNYRFPTLGFLALTIAPIPLGIARRAIDELVALASSKTPMGSFNKLRDKSITQVEIAKAEAILRSARAWLFELTDELWGKAMRGDEFTMEDRSMLRMACAHAAFEGARATDIAYTLGGGTSLYEKSVLQRCLRDAHAATQHIMHTWPNYEVAGRVMLGLDPGSPMV
jgi:alkylation response protein AidB-like acyl-CoA dehydrogenase